LKPQLVALDSGAHNNDLSASTTRSNYNKAQQRAWYLANSEKKKKYAKEYYAKNRNEKIEFAKKYRAENPHITLASRLRCNYGLTLQQYENMLSAQGNKCAICSIELTGEKKTTKPNVDHCHKTGVVRGILCGVCNTGLGHLERDGFLSAAIKYLGDK
jgi:hypothetical protein